MKNHLRSYLKNLLITLAILSSATCLSFLMQQADANSGNATLVFVLSVLLVSRFTDGYFWGVFSSLIAVFIINYVFTFPYYHFNLTISGYLLTFMVNLCISIIVSVMNTRIKQQEQIRLLAERERLRADLFRAVSHDLRTPLTSIIGSTGVILENELPYEKQKELIEDVNTDAQWLLRMVENLLAVTRVTGNGKALKMQTEVVEEVISESIIKFSKHFPGIEVDLEESDDILFADMEPVLISQVVTNLLENAAYHGGTTDKIIVKLFANNDFVYVSVTDNGNGIPADKLDRIFSDNDISANRRSADSRKGMGIGLSVCMSIIIAHGGKMTADNNPGGGAVFTFTLPQKELNYGN